MSDIVARLRSGRTPQVNGVMMTWESQCNEAADEIERLRADLASEREACAKFLDDCARNRMPADVAKLLRHEASGIRNGIHRMEPK